MKNFEKWFEETYPLPPTIERGPIGRDMKAACKASYREALEWTLTQETSIAYSVPVVLTDIIRKELHE